MDGGRRHGEPGQVRAEHGRQWHEAIGAFFGVEDDWVRPLPPGVARRDTIIAVCFLFFTVVGLELTRAMGALDHVDAPVAQQYVAVVAGTLPLIWRRRYPITVMVLLQVHMFVAGVWVVSVMGQFAMQVLYFYALFSGVAWARDRLRLTYAVGGVLLLMFGWLTWSYAVGSALDGLVPRADAGSGPVSPLVAATLYAFLMNIVYFGGALVWGRSSWRAARRFATVEEQARTIESQADTLRDRAVVAERLRIARELHDVIAHHVSVMGVQAAAARRVLTRDPDAAARALSSVEDSSRQAVGEMRALLGTLRDSSDSSSAARGTPGPGGARTRAPEPGLPDVPALVGGALRPGLAATYDLVEEAPDALQSVPAPLSLSAYRVVQEALSNVAKHSTASHVHVAVRVAGASGPERYVEVEVVDDGRPIGATSGTGLGQLGMRERIASHGGQLDVGPRLLGGYRVRARFPLQRAGGAPGAGDGPELRADIALPAARGV